MGISLTQIDIKCTTLLPVDCLPCHTRGKISAGGLCLFVKELLPSYYDRDRINFVSQGVLRIHMPGLAFNNGNWIYVLTVFRVFSLSTAILLPALCCICISIGGAGLWESVRYVSVVILSAGLITATYAVGKKYES